MPCLCIVVVSNLRRQAVANKAAAAIQVVSVDACTSSRAQPPAHQELNGRAAPVATRRRTRKKRDSGAARAAVGAAGDSTDSSEDTSATAADTSRPKLRRKKKTRTKKKTKQSSVECLAVEHSVSPVKGTILEVGNVSADDFDEFSAEEESRPNGDVMTANHPSSSFVDICMALPEVDSLSCEADASSSRPEAEVVDYSVCSTTGSGRDRGRSPAAAPQTSPLPPSTAASTSLYGQQSSFLSDVHGSLPLLTRALENDRRLVPASERSTSDAGRLPKSVSLQGCQNLLSVDDAISSARHRRHRRHLTSSNYRPLTGARGRHTLSRLDVEYINRSQIFEMISGQWQELGMIQSATSANVTKCIFEPLVLSVRL